MELALFTDNKLDEQKKEEVFKHLSQCKRCREVLQVASEIRVEETKVELSNIETGTIDKNIKYCKRLFNKYFGGE